MALTQLKTWIAEILTHTDLNAEFQQIYTQALSLISPLTGDLKANANAIILDADEDSSITVDTDDRMDLRVGGLDAVRINANGITPVEGLDIIPGTVGVSVAIQTNSTADIGIDFETSESEEMLKIAAVASAVNEITITNAATGAFPTISCTGEADTGIDFENSEGEEILKLDAIASAVNEITIKNAATGNRPILAATGEADNGIEFHNDQGEEILILQSAASSVNEVTITSAATGTAPSIVSSGEANIDLAIDADGTGSVKLGAAGIKFANSDGAAGNYIFVTDGSAATSFASNVIGTGIATGTVIPLPRSYLAGGVTSIGTDTTNDIDIAAGQCRDSTDTCNIVWSTAFGKQTDNPAATGGTTGTPTGGFPTGITRTNGVWYHVFVISDGSNVAAGFDSDLSATNLIADHSGGGGSDLSGYTYFRRLGSIYWTSSTITDYKQVGDEFTWIVQHGGADTVANNAENTHDLTWVPTGLSVLATLNVYAGDANACIGSIYDPDVTSSVPPSAGSAATNFYTSALGKATQRQIFVRTDTSRQIQHRWSEGMDNVNLYVCGWVDRRGRDD